MPTVNRCTLTKGHAGDCSAALTPNMMRAGRTCLKPIAQQTYFAVGPNVWGKGATVNAAVKQCRKANNNHKPAILIVYEVEDKNATVDPVSGGIVHARDTRVSEVYKRYEKRVHLNVVGYRE